MSNILGKFFESEKKKKGLNLTKSHDKSHCWNQERKLNLLDFLQQANCSKLRPKKQTL